ADGAEHHSDRADFRRDRERERAIVRLGMSYIRFGYEDLVHHPQRTRAEMRAALLAGPPGR
ncbi:MAG: type IV toxin-antitoxin system AbiEi family antitoxin domain-containing protein, partial [Motilibacteraceae bacterium]